MNIQDFFKQYGIEYREHGSHHHTTPGRIQIDCPWCSPDTQRFRLGWHIKGRYFTCWHCGPVRVTDTLVEITKESFHVIKEALGSVLPEDFFDTKRKLSSKVQIPESVGKLQPAHIEYLQSRGFTKTRISYLIGRYGIGGINHLDEKLSWRIFIPVHLDREVVTWTTRSIDNRARVRYLSASIEESKFNIKQLLYGEDYCKRHTILVCEAPLSVWVLGAGSVATFGTEYSSYQVNKIARYPIRYICYDSDKESQRKAKQLCNVLKVFKGETHNIVLEEKDPGESTRKEIKQLRRLLK